MEAALDEELIADFFGEYDDACLTIREILVELDQNPDDEAAPHALFRSMHSVKSNLRMMGLNELSEFVHQMENILDQIRENKRDYVPLMRDLFLLSLEALRDLCHAQLRDNPAALKDLPKFMQAVTNVYELGNEDRVLVNAIRVFDPGFEHDAVPEVTESGKVEAEAAPVEETAAVQPVILQDLELFKYLSQAMEQRVIGKQGSTQRIVEMALAMNALAGCPIDNDQLMAAAYMHDVGMAFLPLSLVNKESSYSEAERQKLGYHPQVAARMLQRLDNWQEAAKIVTQHHERIDGSGYPQRLRGEDIVPGAKLLSIADTFESMSQKRADREHKRTVIRIVAEINGHKGAQFDEYWVDIFNQYIRQKFSK